MKTCCVCGETKEVGGFHRDSSKKDGFHTRCKECSNKRSKLWREKNPEYNKQWRNSNRERYRELINNWSKHNIDRKRELRKNYREANKERLSEIRKERYRNDPVYKTDRMVRCLLYRTLKGHKSKSTEKMLGYGGKDLKTRIEYQFRDGMSWNNHGEWEIDHKIPVSYFLLKGEHRPHIINALSNLQPLWKEENREKGSNLTF